jgi:hypothetical protein
MLLLDDAQECMKMFSTHNQLMSLIGMVLFVSISTPLHAVSSTATVNVKVTRFLSLANTSAMNFGEISINSVAGAVTLNSDGTRESTGGVKINGSGSYSPAKFVIEGARNADYSISFPDEIVMTDGFGNSLIVNQIQSEQFEAGSEDSNDLKELVLGAKLNLEAYQATGAYSGSLVVEVEYR